MKKLVMCLALLALSLCRTFAQAGGVKVDLLLDQEQFLPSEELRIAVRVSNFSGQTLTLGKEEDWLSFYVEALDGFIVTKLENPPVKGEFSLESSMTATRRADLAPYFNLQKPGRYRVLAKIKIPQWNQEITSTTRQFDIVKGVRIAALEFGVPAQAGETNYVPEVRKYILQQASYKDERQLYFRLTDGEEVRTLKVFPISRVVSFARPEAQIERFSNLHVLFQSGKSSFCYVMINSDGQILLRQTHDFYGESRPRLRTQEDGRIALSGGIRRVTETDLPPSDALSLN
jgi:hypothetical protein